jgi:hypothetical protein
MALPEVRSSQDSYDMARDDLESIIEFLKSSEAGTLTHSVWFWFGTHAEYDKLVGR